jgi:hypothetical protein
MPTATIMDIDTLPVMLHTHHVEALTGLSRPKVYELLRQPGCPTVRFGTAIRVLRDPFLHWLGKQAGNEGEA